MQFLFLKEIFLCIGVSDRFDKGLPLKFKYDSYNVVNFYCLKILFNKNKVICNAFILKPIRILKSVMLIYRILN